MSVPWYIQQLKSFADGPHSWGKAADNRGKAMSEYTEWVARDYARKMGGKTRDQFSQRDQQTAPPPLKRNKTGRSQGIGAQSPWQYSPLSSMTGGGMGGGMQTDYGAGYNINTSIDPTQVYSPAQTNLAVNQATANQHMAGNLPHLLNMTARPGMSSRSPASYAQVAPAHAEANTMARMAQAQIPFQDAQANAQHLLSGQVAREREAIGLGRLAIQRRGMDQAFDTSGNLQLLQLLSQYA